MKQDLLNFWKTEGLRHIIPNTGEEFPEGWDVREQLRLFIGDRAVAEIGCGYGRLCGAFEASRYTGFDINPAAIEEAKRRNPGYTFRLMENEHDYRIEDAALLYTVLLHIGDEDVGDAVAGVCRQAKRVLVAEIMERKWRRPGNPPVFNRAPEEYEALFARHGFAVKEAIPLPYLRYPDTEITFMVCERHG